ncbi:MAG: exonuclease SbcCD subunit D [Planctomycetota bacterium]
MRVTFIHTADLQLGMKAAHAGRAAERVRAERLEALRRVMAVAVERGAQFVLIAGDLFEHHAIEPVLVQSAIDALAAPDVPVFILPGNHDVDRPGSVWGHPGWARHPHLHLLRSQPPVQPCEGVWLFPCPAQPGREDDDPTAWIDANGTDGIRIGIAHGSLETLPHDTTGHRISCDAAERSGLDYLALGHWHSTFMLPRPGGTRVAYSGTPEPSGYDEADSGNVLLVTIAANGSQPKVEKIAIGRLHWEQREHDVRGHGDLPAIRESYETLEPDPDRLMRVRISGLMAPDEASEIDRIRELLDARTAAFQLDTSELHLLPQTNGWLKRLPEGPLRMAAERLAKVAWGEADEAALPTDGDEPVTPQLAEQALIELYRHLEGTN